MPDYVPFTQQPKTPLRSIFTAASDDALDLLESLLTFNPAKRPTAKEALEHYYFKSAPLPTDPTKLPKPLGKEQTQSTMPVRGIQPKKLKF